MEVADFGSIGSNDLIQYLFAVDRNNEQVAYDYRSDRKVLWDLMQRVSRAARTAGKPLSICGELGGDPDFVDRLVSIGIRTVSSGVRSIPGIRHAFLKSEREAGTHEQTASAGALHI